MKFNLVIIFLVTYFCISTAAPVPEPQATDGSSQPANPDLSNTTPASTSDTTESSTASTTSASTESSTASTTSASTESSTASTTSASTESSTASTPVSSTASTTASPPTPATATTTMAPATTRRVPRVPIIDPRQQFSWGYFGNGGNLSLENGRETGTFSGSLRGVGSGYYYSPGSK